ncbi:MAG: 50S ribosomal protein L25 [Deltaproteobacteria bacterium]|nr:50S ribosomal protein L25 [Deltaproteobacteria bacterium]
MDAITLNLEERNVKGGSAADRLRREGFIPAVVYGRKTENKLAKISDREFNKSRAGRGISQLYRFKSESKDLDGQLALIKDSQYEPLKGRTTHIDFLAISEDQSIALEVPISIVGESPSVKAGDAILNQSVHEIRIECIPSKIPGSIIVDISALMLGQSIHAGGLTLPDGVKLKSDEELNIVSVVHKKEEEIGGQAAAAATAAEGAAAAPAAGADAKAPEAAKGDKK